ncbi:MAG: alpha/beta fold hydrolase [Candidatus Limnocylindrales bacterium]
MTALEALRVDRGGTALVGERRRGPGKAVVLLHEGVADRRSWRDVVGELDAALDVVSYDRRGHGDTAPPAGPFSHVEDLLAVLDHVGVGPAWLVGSSAGGGIAVDAALVAADRVAGLVLLAPGISGAPEPDLDRDTARFERPLERAVAAGDLEEANRLETWLWLDGPAQREGRVPGAARELALAMNAVVLAHGVAEEAGTSGVDAWSRLEELSLPVTVACGDLDAPFLVERSRGVADRVPGAAHRVLAGTAHLSALEHPQAVAGVISAAVAG